MVTISVFIPRQQQEYNDRCCYFTGVQRKSIHRASDGSLDLYCLLANQIQRDTIKVQHGEMLDAVLIWQKDPENCPKRTDRIGIQNWFRHYRMACVCLPAKTLGNQPITRVTIMNCIIRYPTDIHCDLQRECQSRGANGTRIRATIIEWSHDMSKLFDYGHNDHRSKCGECNDALFTTLLCIDGRH